MKETSVDYIIVGLGLAGSCLAFQLLSRGRRVLAIDQYRDNRSSSIAAGLYNPVTGQNMVKTWMADTLFPYLRRYYREVEDASGESFFYELPMYRPFAAAGEQNEWIARSSDPAYQGLIRHIHTAPVIEGIRDPLGGLELTHTGYISTTGFLAAVRRMLQARNAYTDARLDYSEVIIRGNIVQWEGVSARKIVFCEGPGVSLNPWFGTVPVRPLKGETVYIKTAFRKDVIINRGVYMVPGKAPGEWRVGSTYNYSDSTPGITSGARRELEEKLSALADFEYEVMDQDWGVRPATPDRRPILGKHAKHEQLIIFNGLGTKGVSLAPYFSEVLFHWMENPASSLNKDIDVSRFKSLY